MTKLNNDKIKQYYFYCPGCKDWHSINVGSGTSHPVWMFNYNMEYPTFRPSVLIRSGCKASTHKSGDDCWCNYEKNYGEPAPFKCGVCHFYITDGKIEFLSDCTHEFAGRLVDMILLKDKPS